MSSQMPAPSATTPKDAALNAVSVPPVLVEKVQDDPELLAQITRGQRLLVQDAMVRRALQDENTTLPQMVSVVDVLAKSDKASKDAPAFNGLKLVINFNRGAGRQPVTIEGGETLPAEAAHAGD